MVGIRCRAGGGGGGRSGNSVKRGFDAVRCGSKQTKTRHLRADGRQVQRQSGLFENVPKHSGIIYGYGCECEWKCGYRCGCVGMGVSASAGVDGCKCGCGGESELWVSVNGCEDGCELLVSVGVYVQVQCCSTICDDEVLSSRETRWVAERHNGQHQPMADVVDMRERHHVVAYTQAGQGAGKGVGTRMEREARKLTTWLSSTFSEHSQSPRHERLHPMHIGCETRNMVTDIAVHLHHGGQEQLVRVAIHLREMMVDNAFMVRTCVLQRVRVSGVQPDGGRRRRCGVHVDCWPMSRQGAWCQQPNMEKGLTSRPPPRGRPLLQALWCAHTRARTRT